MFQLLRVLLGLVCCFFLKHRHCVQSSTAIYYQNKHNYKVVTRIFTFPISHTSHCSVSNCRTGTTPLLWPAMEVTSPSERITAFLRKHDCSQAMCTVQIVLSNIHSLYNEEIPLKPHSRKTTGMQFIKITALASLASSQDLHRTHWSFRVCRLNPSVRAKQDILKAVLHSSSNTNEENNLWSFS